MSDYMHDVTEEQLSELEDRIADSFAEASEEMQETVDDYFDALKDRDAEQQKLVKSGKLSEDEYNLWRQNQFARGERYQQMVDNLASQATNANEVAISYVNDAMPSVYANNRNYTAYTIRSAGGSVDFNLWDESTVRNLLLNNDRSIMPNYPQSKAIVRGIDLAYGQRQIKASILSGILQGKSIAAIARDLMNRIKGMCLNSALRAARTAITEAENAGRQDEYEEAKKMGIDMQKVWLATSDSRTRPDHAEADGQAVDVDDPFIVGGEELMYPGDPSGSPGQIYNCRCTTIAKLNDNEPEENPQTGEVDSIDDCKTMEDLVKYMESNYDIYLASSLNSLNFDLVKGTMAGIDYMCRKYPELSRTIMGMQAGPSGVMASTGNAITYNPRYFNYTTQQFQAMIDNNVRAGYWSGGTSLKTIGAHECGHVFEQVLINNNPEYRGSSLLGADAWNNCTEAKKVVQNASRSIKKTEYGSGKGINDLVKGISGYATKNRSEAMAEAFADVCGNGDNANPFSKAIVKSAESLYNKYKKEG